MATEPEVRQYLRRLRFKRRLEGPRLDMRPRVHAPTVLQKIFKQRNQKRSTYYVTSGRQVPEAKEDADEEGAAEDGAPARARDQAEGLWKQGRQPFWIPPDELFAPFVAFQKEQAALERKRELALPVHKKPNARTRLTTDLLRRLHIPEDPPPTEKTMVDMDPEFYTIVEGRPNRDRVSLREYIGHIRDLVRVRLKIGINEDECILVDEQFRLERERLEQILGQQKQYVDLFDQFLAEDHAASMELLKKADQAARLSAEKDAEIKVWIRTKGVLRTQVYQLEERWMEARSLQKFLYLVSPMSWRREHDHLNGAVPAEGFSETDVGGDAAAGAGAGARSGAGDRRHSGVTQATQGTQVSLASRDPMERAASLQNIIDAFLEETKTSHPPKLYFTEPEQLVKVFRSLAAQSLASLVHIEQLRLPLEALQAGVAQARERVERGLSALQEQVADLEREIAWEENRVLQLQQHADVILMKVYKDILTGSGVDNVLTLRVWVEDVYERCVAPNDSHLTSYQMMCAVERIVAAELLALDYLDQEHVKRARKHVYLEDRRQMGSAQDAHRKLQQMQQLVYRMERALEPPPPRGHRRLVFRSRPPEPRPPPPPPPEQLSEEELDRRAFFSECDDADRDRLSKLISPVPKSVARLLGRGGGGGGVRHQVSPNDSQSEYTKDVVWSVTHFSSANQRE
ncbi:Cilia- and flagella-associated protein 100 [Frankliniella fusca]|uniref:Cilia- and flagella-associated protein 100 n=1 Tax=Frankliniella fusca TaxID=407009 RepID=A0AAE1LUH5_9NEOP|nr:Cilia- and flagella-associated protein 100 [Frankliniella fusca]